LTKPTKPKQMTRTRIGRILLVFILAISFLPVSSQTKSAKKGLGYGNHSVADMEVISPGVSWWYNWYYQPEAAVFSSYQNLNMEFVPMAWNGDFDETALRNYLSAHPDVKYLLGFNEPNFTTQANMTTEEAAAVWPRLEAIADDYGLKLVSPAVNYCDNCVDIPGTDNDSDPTAWLDAFFAACPDCRVDYIAVHWYACSVDALSWYIDMFKKYNRPIWLTEFACWENNPTLDDQMSYMIGALNYLEQDSSVFRYAWFTGRSDGPNISIFDDASGTLTPLGDLYVNFNPGHDTTSFTDIPARIEAENYSRMQGIQLEKTSDVDGFANVGWIDDGDWLEYNINVTEAKDYPFYVRTAGTATGQIAAQIDGETIKTMTIPSTGGWQTWTTVSSNLSLPQGEHLLRLNVQTGGFNLNWLQIGDDVSAITDISKNNGRVYPQPLLQNPLSIQFGNPLNENITVSLFDMTGKEVFDKEMSVTSDNLKIFIPEYLFRTNGLYLMRLQTKNKLLTSKILIHGK